MSRSVVNRRAFAKQLAAGSLAAAPLAIAVSGASEKGPRPADQSVAPAELVLQLLQQLYPHPLDDAQRAEIQKQIVEDQRRSKILSGFPLTNADEPGPTFAAWRGEG
ncbi:MAG TPA: hypothetical protein VGN42_02195 [Pirellulales bacterium]|nr:hypothetical protein [Pirellulales bacterium]